MIAEELEEGISRIGRRSGADLEIGVKSTLVEK
jgi:hypothetical protein